MIPPSETFVDPCPVERPTAAHPEVPCVAPVSDLSHLREKIRSLADSNVPRPSAHSLADTLPSAESGSDAKPARESLGRGTAPLAAEDSAESASQPAGRKADSSIDLASAKIMIVDDEEANVLTVQCYLENEGYRSFLSTTDPRKALGIAHTQNPDLLLLDINMPHLNGIDILRAMSMDETLRYVPVLILTASSDPKIKQDALNLGAYDFLTKPVDPNDLIPRVRNALVVKSHYDQKANEAANLEELVRQRTAELFQSRQQLILSLARAAEHRDNETSNHVIRVGRFAAIIADELGWSVDQVEMLEQAAQLHDVGKIGIPDDILFKPGRLDPDEFDLIKKHCAMGQDIIQPMSERDFQVLRAHVRVGESILHVRSSPMLMMAARIAQTHHEHWDGNGYPLGLAGEDIPIEGRITAVADVYDALSSNRPYKDAFPRQKCFEILEEGRGTHFDSDVLDSFFRRSKDIVRIQLDFMDR